MKTSTIIQEINSGFAAVYKTSAPFVGSGGLCNFCMSVIGDPMLMSCLVFANDLGVPPVRSLLLLYSRANNPEPDFRFNKTDTQRMGALMAYVLKHVLGYRSQKDRCAVNQLGVKQATKYTDGPVLTFTI